MKVQNIICALIILLSAAEAAARTNVVLIVVDDLGWKDLGVYGSRFYETPNIDEFASNATRFTDAYASASICSPTRAALHTGRHPARVGITDWITGYDYKKDSPKLETPEDLHALPDAEVILAEQLAEAGYQTFFAGKWHLGKEGSLPEDHGFEINIGGIGLGYPPGGYYTPYENPRLSDGPEGEYLTDRLTNESIDFLETRDKERPFLLHLSYYSVHTPIEACERYLDYYTRKAKKEGLEDTTTLVEGEAISRVEQNNPAYATMVAAVDENVGRLLEALEERNLRDDTVVILTSDNGGLSTIFNDPGPTSNLPLRSGKGWLYEGGIRIPLIIDAPKSFQSQPELSREPVVTTDLYPTILDLVNIEPGSELQLDGQSLMPLLERTELGSPRALYWHYPHYHGSGWKPGGAVRLGNWKLIEFFETGEHELYDLAVDLEERNDLAESYPEITRDLRHRLREWRKETDAKMPNPVKEK